MAAADHALLAATSEWLDRNDRCFSRLARDASDSSTALAFTGNQFPLPLVSTHGDGYARMLLARNSDDHQLRRVLAPLVANRRAGA